VEELNAIQKLAVWALPVLFAITVHEVAHGWVALRCGDRTAQMMGRLTLNPIKHIDPIGTLLVPAILLLLGGFMFGWAKPVPVTWENLRRPKRDIGLVAVAGPLSNLIMAMLWALILYFALGISRDTTSFIYPLVLMAYAGISINVVLMVLNLLPLLPLDGGRVLVSLLPGPIAYQFSRLEPWGFPILIILMVTGVLGTLLGTPVSVIQGLMYSIAGL
jgi:Zn-dependent protease